MNEYESHVLLEKLLSEWSMRTRCSNNACNLPKKDKVFDTIKILEKSSVTYNGRWFMRSISCYFNHLTVIGSVAPEFDKVIFDHV